MHDPRAWRALARGPEYIPPHTSVHQGAPIRPPPYHSPSETHAVVTAATSSHIQGPPSPTSISNKLSRPQGFSSSSSATKSPNGKIGGRQKPHLVFPFDTRPARASKTLTKLLDKLEDDQKRDIHTRISGHLNHDKVFEGLVKASQEGGGSSHRRGRRGRPAANEDNSHNPNHEMPPSVIHIPLSSTQDSEDSIDPIIQPRTPPPARSKSRHDKRQPLGAVTASPSIATNDVISAVIHQKIRNPDRASILYHQYLDEVELEPTPLGKLHVASRYFDVLIQDFRLFAPLLSGIKTAYHDVVEQYITDLNELEALKRGLIVSIARHQAKASSHDQLIEQVTQLQHEKDELAAQVRTLEQMMQHSKDPLMHGGSRGAFHSHHAHGTTQGYSSQHHAPSTSSHMSNIAGSAQQVQTVSSLSAAPGSATVATSFQQQPPVVVPSPPRSPRGVRSRTGSVTASSILSGAKMATATHPLHLVSSAMNESVDQGSRAADCDDKEETGQPAMALPAQRGSSRPDAENVDDASNGVVGRMRTGMHEGRPDTSLLDAGSGGEGRRNNEEGGLGQDTGEAGGLDDS